MDNKKKDRELIDEVIQSLNDLALIYGEGMHNLRKPYEGPLNQEERWEAEAREKKRRLEEWKRRQQK